uniref:Uncharacterized protein n=1 Tax=Anguilla anguilla TaxID=7936 RepID=A0A0E9UT43_ANGAN
MDCSRLLSHRKQVLVGSIYSLSGATFICLFR